MNEISTQLAADLPTITAEINAYKRVAGEAIFEIGRRLKHVKEMKLAETHGGWTAWLRQIDMSTSQADRFVKITERLGDTKFPTSGTIAMGILDEISTLPSDIDRSDFVSRPHTIPSTGATKTVDEMTVRELREVKAALKAEREAREEAERRAQKAERDYENVREALDQVGEPRVEVRTEYVKVPDDSTAERLRRYEDKFGDIEVYEAGAIRIDGISDISAAIQTFSYEARELMKKYGFLAQFGGDIKRMHGAVVEDYGAAIDAMYMFSREMRDILDSMKAGSRVINI